MTTSATPQDPHPFPLWFGVLGGAFAWGLHLIGASVVAEWGYFAGMQYNTAKGPTMIVWFILALSLAMMLLAGAATFVAWGMCKKQRLYSDSQKRRGAVSFLARLGLLSSGLFLFIILAQSVPLLFFLTEH